MHRCLTWTLIPWLVRHTKLAKKVCPAYRSSWTTKEVGPNLEVTSFPLHRAHGRGQCRQVEPVQASGGYQGDRGLEKCGRETSAIKEKWDCWGMEGGRCPKSTGWVLGVYEDQRKQCSCFCSKYIIAPDGRQSFSEEAEILCNVKEIFHHRMLLCCWLKEVRSITPTPNSIGVRTRGKSWAIWCNPAVKPQRLHRPESCLSKNIMRISS